MKKSLLIYLVFLLPLRVNAQLIYLPDTIVKRFFLMQQLTGSRYMDAGHKNSGMYFTDEWCPGNIWLTSGRKVNDLMLRYNGFTDDLVWMRQRVMQVTLDKNNIKAFDILMNGRDHYFEKRMITHEKDSAETFCEVLHSGKVQLVAIRKTRLESESFKGYVPYYNYAPHPVYYLFIRGRTYFLKNCKLRTLYSTFPELEDKIRQRVHEQHIRRRKEANFIKAVIAIEDILAGGR